jgi:hypothetical protein
MVMSDGGISSSGFQFTNSIYSLSYGATGLTTSGIIPLVPICGDGCATFPVVPLPTTNVSFITGLNTTAVSIGAGGVVASPVWKNNVGICGTLSFGGEPWPDLDQSGCTAVFSTFGMPTTDSFPNPAGGTIAARNIAAGLLNAANSDLTVTPTAANFGGSVGADLQGLTAELGIVKNISVVAGPTSLQFSYTAPDSAACAVDTSSNGTTWTRTTDTGGSRARVLLVSSLASSTSYQTRGPMCYFDQQRPWFSVPWEHSSMTTNGTYSTKAAGTSTVPVSASCPASGVLSIKITLTPLVGSVVNGNANCTNLPPANPTGTISVAGTTNGAVNELVEYWSGTGATGTVVSHGTALIP